MKKNDLLRSIAEAGYNVGFGAKKHFATYDIVSKIPSFIGFVSTGVGVFGLFMEELSTKVFSAAFIVLGVMGICISHYDREKENYNRAAIELTRLLGKLKILYYRVKNSDEVPMDPFVAELEEIEREFSGVGISDQILLSDWYAHYKFFWQHQIEWIDEQKKFRFFRDKIPLSFSFVVVATLICVAAYFFLR